MSVPASESPSYGPRSPYEEWRGRAQMAGWRRSGGGSGGSLLLTGLVVVGLGRLAWNYLGPDLRRYLKIQNM
jgi:hypothetical protein